MRALEIVAPGPRAHVQDAGRLGLRGAGVPPCGAADGPLWRLGNGVAGAPEGAAAVEFALRGPTVRAVGGPVRVALAGAAGRLGERGALPALRSATLAEGETLTVGAVEGGAVGYLCVGGGLDLPPVLGARATDLRAGFGGVAGRALAAGDRLPVGGPPPAGPERAGALPQATAGPLRVVMGPQTAHFTEAALAAFLDAEWRVSDQVDRMGARLLGPRLVHSDLGADMVSEGMLRGAIQVPGDGAPIILGVDAHTIGGYPKIAVVISADLPRVGQLLPGAAVRFAAVTVEQAVGARRAAESALAEALAAVAALRDGPDLAMLASSNLVSGVIDARRPSLPGGLEETTP